MNETKYHLLRVTSYKGGELRPNLNLPKIELIEKILETFIDTDFYYESEEPLTEEQIVKYLRNVNNLPEFSEYAGGDSYVAKVYCTTPAGELKEIDITQFIKDNVSDFTKILITNNQE